MSNEEDSNPFPFAHPVKDLENLVPLRFQKGLSTIHIHFTCLDATTNYIVVGTNVGVTYLFNRITGEMQKLQCQGSTHPVSSVRCLETIDLMVALGTSAGLIVVFRIPLHRRSSSDVVDEVERYLITDIHLHRITCLEWSLNGMKLFSGSDSGVVAQTDIDYMQHVSKSVILLEERDSVVQIGYCQRMLLVSTVRRTLLCFATDDFHIVQIGQKERKSLGNYGACFFTVAEIPQEVVIFAARPALRFWKANADGKVLETFIFKENSLGAHQMLSVGYDQSSNLPLRSDSQFGVMHAFENKCLVTWNGRKMFVVTLQEPAIVFQCDVFGGIVSASVSEDEIFVLSGQRSVTRIATSSDHSRFIPIPVKEESLLPTLNFMPNALKELESRFKGSSIFSKIKQKLPSENPAGLECEPMTALPAVNEDCFTAVGHQVNSDTGSEKVIESQDPPILVSEQQASGDDLSPEMVRSAPDVWSPLPDTVDSESDDADGGGGIVFERIAKVKRARSPIEPAVSQNLDVTGTEFQLDVGERETSVELAVAETLPHDADAIVVPGGSRQEKEILLAQMFNLEELLPEEMKRKPVDATVVVFDPVDAGPLQEEVAAPQPAAEIPLLDEVQCSATNESQYNSSDFEFYRTNRTKDDDDGEMMNPAVSECSSYLSYGPPSGSSNIPSLNDIRADVCNSASLTVPVMVTKSLNLDNALHVGSQPLPDRDEARCSASNGECNNVWVQHRPPGHLRSLAVCDHYIVCTDHKDVVYYSSFGGLALEWHKADYLANQIAVSQSGKRVWRVYRNSVYVLVQPSTHGPFGKRWVQVELNVIQVAVNENCAWYVTMNGDVFVQCFLNEEQVYTHPTLVACPTKVTHVACSDTIIWAITVDQVLICRLGITKENPQGTKWGEISFTYGKVLAVAVGTTTGWVVDEALSLWFKSGLSMSTPPKVTDKKWWQVKITDYVYSNATVLQNLMGSLNTEQLTLMLSKQNTPCIVCTKLQAIWFYHPQMNQLLTNQKQIIGHQWNHIKMPLRCSTQWRSMTSSGIYHHHGVIWLWRQGLDLGCFSPVSSTLSNVKMPECCRDSPPLCLSAAPETFWLLAESGQIFIRKDITVLNAIGTGWVELDLSQIDKHKLTHISCGSNLVWACDSRGGILMRIGSLHAPAIHNFLPAWVVVEDASSATPPHFIKVYVGPLDYAVWAIDNKNNVYVREGIFPELLIGIGWVLVSGVQATQLAISECAVYALTLGGTIYRRYNISQNNYIGDYWMELPGQAEQISVSVDDKLWALSSKDELLQHQSYVLYSSKGKLKDSAMKASAVTSRHESVDEDWEMVDDCA